MELPAENGDSPMSASTHKRDILTNRAAAALDRTHNPALSLAGDPRTVRLRIALAAYLDGKRRMTAASVTAACRWLELVAA